MAGTTVGTIVSNVIVELSQVPGVATQIYSAGRIRQHVQDAYQMEIDELWWPRYMVWQTVPVDQLTGLLTADIQGPISFVDDYENIRAVFPSGSSRQLPEFPLGLNPFSVTGGSRLYVTPDYTVPHRPFKVLPVGSATNVVVHARQDTAMPFSDTTTVYIDSLLLQYDAAWMYCVDDGTVPAQVNKFQMLAAKRRKRIIAALAQQPLLLDPRFPTGVDTLVDDNPFFVLDSDVLA
jgi:hypothetical protein